MEKLMQPPEPGAVGYTSVRRPTLDPEWTITEPPRAIEEWSPTIFFPDDEEAEPGVMVGDEEFDPQLTTHYEPPYLPPLEEWLESDPTVRTTTGGVGITIQGGSSVAELDPPGDLGWPPAWDGEKTASGLQMLVGHVGYSYVPDRIVDNRCRVAKISFSINVPQDVEIHNMYLRLSSITQNGQANKASLTNESVNFDIPRYVHPDSYSNGTAGASFFCSNDNTTYNWTEMTLDPTLEPNYLHTWSAEYSDNHFSLEPEDYKPTVSGDAISSLPLDAATLTATYSDGEGNILIPLQDWEDRIEDGVLTLIFAIDDDPDPPKQVFNFWRNTFPVRWETQQFHDVLENCNGSAPFTVQRLEGSLGTFGGLQLNGAQLWIDHEPWWFEPPFFNPEIDERGIVYFKVPQLPEGATVMKSELLLWSVMAFSTDDSQIYGLFTTPDDEGIPPITVEKYHPEGLEDKTDRAVWQIAINDIPDPPPQPFPKLISINVPNGMIRSFAMVGFQTAILPASEDPFQFSQVLMMNDASAGGPGSPYHGPRLRLTLLIAAGLEEVPVAVTLMIAPVQIAAAIEVEQDQSILLHKAVQNRATRRSL